MLSLLLSKIIYAYWIPDSEIHLWYLPPDSTSYPAASAFLVNFFTIKVDSVIFILFSL